MVTASPFYPALHHFKSSLQIMIILCYVRCVLWFHRSRAEQESENASKGQKYTKTNKQNTPKYRIIKLSCETRLNIICAINLVSVPALIKKLPLEGEIRTVKLSMKLSINPSLVMMRECPCSTKTREVLGNPSPPPSRFSSAVGFAPLDPRDFPRASPSGNPSGLGVQNPRPRKISRISLDPRDFPRASPSGNLLGLGKLGGGDGFPNTSLLLVEHGYNVRPILSISSIKSSLEHEYWLSLAPNNKI